MSRTKVKYFVLEFKTKERDDEFNQIIADYKRFGVTVKVEKLSLRNPIYKVIYTVKTDIVWDILLHKYLSMSHDQERKENGEKFYPVRFILGKAA